jgi:hypothetical protein
LSSSVNETTTSNNHLLPFYLTHHHDECGVWVRDTRLLYKRRGSFFFLEAKITKLLTKSRFFPGPNDDNARTTNLSSHDNSLAEKEGALGLIGKEPPFLMSQKRLFLIKKGTYYYTPY